MRRYFFILWVLAASFLLSACSTHISSFSNRPFEVVSSAAENTVLVRLRNVKPIKTFRALVDTRIESPTESERVRYALVADADGRLRIDLFPSNAFYTLGILTVDQKGAVFVDQQREEVFYSLADEFKLEDILKIPLSHNDLFYYLTGRIVPSHFETLQLLGCLRDKPECLLQADNRKVLYLFDPSRLVLTGLQINKDGVEVEILYKKHKQYGDRVLPSIIQMQLAKLRTDLQMEITKSKLDQNISDDIFHIDVPAHFRVAR